jgi:hypothetical protein
MKNFAPKFFLIVISVTALSAAAVAKTTDRDTMVDYFTSASGGDSTYSAFGEAVNNDLINPFLGGEPECWHVRVVKTKYGPREFWKRVPCPK